MFYFKTKYDRRRTLDKDIDRREKIALRQQIISELKTEKLYMLLYRMLQHDDSLQIVNEPNIQGDFLEMDIRGRH